MTGQRRIVRRPVPAVPSDYMGASHPVLRRVFAARAVLDAAALDHSLAGLATYQSLSNIAAASELLGDALDAARRQRVLIVGDYDADGATGCALAVLGLRAMGADAVDYLVPDRQKHGYGLTPEIVELAMLRSPDLIVTVDNGISSHAGVEAAHREGVRVLVTDHHLPPATLPPADAIVNPNQPGDEFPSKALAGVGVMFYLLAAVRARLLDAGYFERRNLDPPNLATLLDLVAVGTVADVVELDHNNRILVEQGLRRIRAGRARPGVLALLAVARRDHTRAVASDLGFAVGPRLNAAGRLEDISLGIECLLRDRREDADEIARALDDINRSRREIEQGMSARANAIVESVTLATGTLPSALCLFEESWHPGVVGIVASRVKERVNRPTVAFAPEDDVHLKGSARSVRGLHIRDAIDRVATLEPGIITRFGGHAMAAGLSLPRAHFERFAARLREVVDDWLGDDDREGELFTDGPLDVADFTLDVARAIRVAAPWGQGFPEPSFDGEFEVAARRVVGETHLKLSLVPTGARQAVDAIAFNQAGLAADVQRVHAVFRLDVNSFRGNETVQLIVEQLEAL